MGVTVCGVWVATQWTAHALGYQPRLGVAWFDLSGLPVYEPWKLFEWWYWYDAYAPEVFSRGGAIAASSGLLATRGSHRHGGVALASGAARHHLWLRPVG
jgi:type IV secretion system protein VirD4